MTETVIKLLNADTCAFSQVEAEVLRRVSEGSTINSISTELGLAEPIVKEYIRSLLRKVRMRDVERTTGSEDEEQCRSRNCSKCYLVEPILGFNLWVADPDPHDGTN